MPAMLTRKKISSQNAIDAVSTKQYGAVSLFLGVVRNNSSDRHRHGAVSKVVRLEYSAYEKMALKKMRETEHSAEKKWRRKGLGRILIVHRLGRLKVGDISVVVAVSAVHRKEAILACRYCIDQIKHSAPIFKKEYFTDGKSLWVGC